MGKKKCSGDRVWCTDLLQTCETALDMTAKREQEENRDQLLVRILFTIGELSLV